MKVNDKTKMSWNVQVTIINPDGSVKEVTTLKNSLTNTAFNTMAAFIAGTAGVSDAQIQYIAWGSSATAFDATQTTLFAELGRKQVVNYSVGGTGAIATNAYLSPYDAAGQTINELGWFIGNALNPVSLVANSGLMYARVLYTHAKTNLESISVIRTDTFSA
jgi:hypothetical protein